MNLVGGPSGSHHAGVRVGTGRPPYPDQRHSGFSMYEYVLRGLAAAALVFISTAASAHSFHAGITDISFNERTGSTEIVHTYMAHDVETLLANLYQRDFDLTQPEDQDVLRKYVERQFWLQGQDKARLPVRWVGMTIDAQSVMVYQEAEKTPLSRTAAIHDEVMIDFLPDQVNTVNLNDGGKVRTFLFESTTTEQPVR
jgi:hypothetical protein